MDPPQHGPKRRMLISDFTVKRVKGLRRNRAHRARLHRRHAGAGRRSTCQQVRVPVPSMVICQLLACRTPDHEFSRTRQATGQSVWTRRIRCRARRLAGYLDELITKLQAEPEPGCSAA